MEKPIDILRHYFPKITDEQLLLFEKLGPFYKEWNQKVNLISRKDIDNLYRHHILHSLSVAKFIRFKDGAQILDLGTGGGFPGIPLAILMPEVNFLLIDGRSKKINVVQELIAHLGLQNAAAMHVRSEELDMSFDFVLARAVTRLERLIPMSFHLIAKKQYHGRPNGLIAMKGGDLTEEIDEVTPMHQVEVKSVQDYFPDIDYFHEKYILYLQS